MDQQKYVGDPHGKCREFLTNLEDLDQFHDVYRNFYPDTKNFTWRECDGKKEARLDIATASPALLNYIKEIKHMAHHFNATDH